MIEENQVIRLFREHLKKENSKLVERAMNTDLKSDPKALLKIAETADLTDPDVVYARRMQEQGRNEDFENMLARNVVKASNTPEQFAAFQNLARHLAQKYGSKAMDRAKELLGAK